MKNTYTFIFTGNETQLYRQFVNEFNSLSTSLNSPKGLEIYTTVDSQKHMEPHNQRRIYLDVSAEIKNSCQEFVKKYSGIETTSPFDGDKIHITGKL